jgi:hypothetical protein
VAGHLRAVTALNIGDWLSLMSRMIFVDHPGQLYLAGKSSDTFFSSLRQLYIRLPLRSSKTLTWQSAGNY